MIETYIDYMDLEKTLGYIIEEGGVQVCALRANLNKANFDPERVKVRLTNQPDCAKAIESEFKKVPLMINDKISAVRAIAKARLLMRK